MTKEEAISILSRPITMKNTPSNILEAHKIAIEALKQEPDEGDCISRQAVLSKIKEVCFSKEWLQFRWHNGSNGQRDFLINYIEKLPPVTPQPPKRGQWIYTYTGEYLTKGIFKCSECGEEIDTSKLYYNFCPKCGAEMFSIDSEPQKSEEE